LIPHSGQVISEKNKKTKEQQYMNVIKRSCIEHRMAKKAFLVINLYKS